MRTPLRTLLALFTVLFFGSTAPPAAARTWHVFVDGSGDAPTIQAGIDSASAGDTVLVHDGTYTGAGNRDLLFPGRSIVLRSASGPDATILDCEGAARGARVHGEGYQVAIEGLTIRNGAASLGAGVSVEATATIRDCRILNCQASVSGGGILANNAHVMVYDCLIQGNSAAQLGGGVYAGQGETEIYRSTLRANRGRDGGGASFLGYFDGGGVLQLDSCLVTGNLATRDGGGVWVDIPETESAIFAFRNTTIAGNRAEREGGGIWGGCSGWIPVGGQSILWGNCAPDLPQIGSPWLFVLDSCDVDTVGLYAEYNGVALMHSISEDPLFCDPVDCAEAPTELGDYHLDAASPCLPGETGGYLIGAYGEGCDIYTGVAVEPTGGAAGAGERAVRVAPNPGPGLFTIEYGLPAGATAVLRVFDIAGRLVRTIEAPASRGTALWDGKDAAGRDAAPGVYFVRASSGVTADTRRVILVR